MIKTFGFDGARFDVISCRTAEGIPALLVRESTTRYTADDLYTATGAIIPDPPLDSLVFRPGERPRKLPEISVEELAALVIQTLEAEVWALWSGVTPELPVKVFRLNNGLPLGAEVDGRVYVLDYHALKGAWGRYEDSFGIPFGF